jgi:CheY-like chemotaxis protein
MQMGTGENTGFAYRILVVDDEPLILNTAALIFRQKGYEVRTAPDGFAALVELRRAVPDVIVSDLSMPRMSGFELLSIIRRRFPQIAVIAVSGEYESITPKGLLCDAFFWKGHYKPDEMLRKIVELLERTPLRPQLAKPDNAPIWIPHTNEGYLVITCTECLRSFSVPREEGGQHLRETQCLFCDSVVCFLAEPIAREPH